MKMILKSLAALAIFTAMSASAQVVINLSGSTAFRKSANTQILNTLTNPTLAYTDKATDGPTKATYAIYKGTFNSTAITVRVYWAGSVEGISYPNTSTAQPFFIPANQSTTTGGVNLGNTTYTDPGVVDAGLSDVFPITAGYGDADLQDDQIGVVPMVFVTHPSAPFSNMTPQLMFQIYQQNACFLSNMYPGGSSTVKVRGCGRNSDSGTRITFLAETGYGYTNSVTQYSFTVDTTTTTGVSLNSPANTGFASGGDLAKSLAKPFNSSLNAWGIGYVGVSDVQGTNTVLTYNGVPFTNANVQNGTYTMWTYEHLITCPRVRDATSGDDLVRQAWLAAFLANMKTDPTASSGIVLSTMKCGRAGDGAAVFNF